MRFFNQTLHLFLVLTLTVATATSLFAQDNVGIGTTTPHENAILDIESTEKGLLTPRLNTLQRLLLVPVANADGLLVYDTDLDEFCYWDGAQWICLPAIGSVGPAGPTGADGANGAAGSAGADGATGPAGAAGPAGVDGATGANGTDGATGPAGINGVAGADGADGVDGATGPTGPVNLRTGIIGSGASVVSGDVTASTSGTGITNVVFNTAFTGSTPTILVTPVGTLSGGGGGGGIVPPASICDPCYTDIEDDFITNVTFNTINNNSVNDGACSFGDYTSINTTVDPGTAYTISVSFLSEATWTEYVSVWFDWNQNGDFEPTERYDIGSGIDATVTLSITIPLSALAGPTRMRVNEDFGDFAADACNTISSAYGETEDYTVIVSSPPSSGGLNVCNVSSVTVNGFQCDCSDLDGAAIDVDYHFSAFGN